MEVICQISLDMLHILKFFVWSELFFKFTKKHRRYSNVFVLALVAVSSVVIFYFDGSFFSVIIMCLCVFGIFIIKYNEKKRLLLAVSLWTIFATTLIDLMSFALAGMLFKITNVGEDTLEEIFVDLITLLFLFLTGYLLRYRCEGSLKQIGIRYLLVFTVMTFADVVVLNTMGNVTLQRMEEKPDSAVGYVFIVMALGLFLQLLMVFFLMISRDTYKEKQNITQKYLEAQIEHYHYLEQREYETKKFRHDLRYHMHILNTLYQNQEYAKMEKYLANANGKIESFSNTISVNHGIVDAILNKYHAEMTAHKQILSVKGHFPMVCRISAYDLCTIFSNLLSNAHEAAPIGTTIKLEIRHIEEEIMLVIENVYEGKVVMKNGELQTTKKDMLSHGLGLGNVKECIRRNGGQMDIVTENQRFVVTVLLKNRGNENEDSSSR